LFSFRPVIRPAQGDVIAGSLHGSLLVTPVKAKFTQRWKKINTHFSVSPRVVGHIDVDNIGLFLAIVPRDGVAEIELGLERDGVVGAWSRSACSRLGHDIIGLQTVVVGLGIGRFNAINNTGCMHENGGTDFGKTEFGGIPYLEQTTGLW
jgi:hypothetical protein